MRRLKGVSGIQASHRQSTVIFQDGCLLAINRQNWSKPLTETQGSYWAPVTCQAHLQIPTHSDDHGGQTFLQTWTPVSHIKCLEVVQTSVVPLLFPDLVLHFLPVLLGVAGGCQLTQNLTGEQ